MERMKRFKTGKTYFAVSPCNTDARWYFMVVSRTAKTVRLRNEDGMEKVCRISDTFGEETCKPLGNYSMAPTLRATTLDF